MSTAQKRRGTVPAAPRRDTSSTPTRSLQQRPQPSQVARLRLTARCLNLAPVFTADAPLTAELFNSRGEPVEVWQW